MSNQINPLVPIYQEASKSFFISEDIFPLTEHHVSDTTKVKTTALLFGKTVDLIGISTNEELITAGEAHPTDTIDPIVSVDKVYLATGNNVIFFNVEDKPEFKFQPGEGPWRHLQAQSQLHKAAGDCVLTLEISVVGTLNLETGTLEMHAAPLHLQYVDSPKNSAVALEEIDRFIAGSVWLGYTLKVNRKRR